jgi:hypothetical protein
LANIILEYEPALDRKKVVASISALLSVKSKEGGEFIKTKNEADEYEFDLARKE